MAKRSAKKNRAAADQPARQNPAAAQSSPAAEPLGREKAGGDAVKGRAFWLAAAISIISGYALLHKVDPGGQNSWAIASPALLLCGYLLIIPAILHTYRAG